MKSEKICVIGAGNFGTALAYQLAKSCDNIMMFSIEEDVVKSINEEHENKRYHPGKKLKDCIKATSSYEEAMKDARYVLLSVPSHVMADVLKDMHPFFKENMILINTAKGLDEQTMLRMSELVKRNTPEFLHKNIATMSGPSIANEMANNVPTAIVIASKNNEILDETKELFSNEKFRVFTSHDMAGIELGGFLKNVIAIASGICDGLNLGTNLKAAVVTRGFYELCKIAELYGADPRTLTGLSGLGDLIVTSFSKHSRNRRFGEKLGEGMPLKQAEREIGQVVEGVRATKVAMDLAKKEGINVMLIKEIYNVIYNHKDPKTALEDFFKSEGGSEFDECYLRTK